MGLDKPRGFEEVEALRFQNSQHMKVVRLSALCTGRLYPPGNIPGTHFCQGRSQPRGHSLAGSIMSMKNSIDTIGNRTRDLPACSAVPQPTASLRVLSKDRSASIFWVNQCKKNVFNSLHLTNKIFKIVS